MTFLSRLASESGLMCSLALTLMTCSGEAPASPYDIDHKCVDSFDAECSCQQIATDCNYRIQEWNGRSCVSKKPVMVVCDFGTPEWNGYKCVAHRELCNFGTTSDYWAGTKTFNVYTNDFDACTPVCGPGQKFDPTTNICYEQKMHLQQ